MNTINIAGIDELGLLKKRLVNKFSKDKNGKTCHFRSCNANIEFLLNDNDVQYNINVSNPPVKTFVSYFCGADVLFFDVNPKNASVIIDYNLGDIVLPDAKLVVFRFSSKEEFAKIASQDLVKCFPNAVIAGFKFKVNGIKGFTNFLHSPNFYKLLNGDSSKDNSDESNKKRITKLLNSDEFKSLCKKNISSDFFYSSAIDEDLYLKANSSEIENYNSLSKAIQCEINKDNDPDKLAKIKNSAVFVGTVMFDAFESLVNDEDLQYNVAIIKNAHHDIYEQFKKKDFDLIFPGYSMPIKTLSGVRPGDIMLSVDDDIMSENFHIVSSVGNDGKVDIVGLNKGKIISKSLNVKDISNGTGSNGFVSDVNYSLNCSVKNKNSVCNVKNGSTYTLVSVAGENISMENVKPLGVEAVKDSSGMSFYFVRPLLLNHLFDELEGEIIPASIVVNKSVSPKQEKDLNKFFKECETSIKNYKIIDYISNTVLANYSEDMNDLIFFEKVGYVMLDESYWNEIQKRINNYNVKSIFTQEEKEAMYQMHKADSSYSVMNEVHKKIFGVDYDEKKVKEANKAFFLYLTIYRFNLIRESIDKQVERIKSSAIKSQFLLSLTCNIDDPAYNYGCDDRKQKGFDLTEKYEHDELFNLFCNIFGVTNKDDYKSLTTDQLIKIITEYTKTFDFIADLLPNIENYASYQSIEAFGYDFAIIIKCEKKLFENARHNGVVLKNALLFITGCLTARIGSVFISAGADAAISVGLDAIDLIYRANFSNSEIDYLSEIVKILVNAILSFGTSAVVGGVMEKFTPKNKISDLINKNDEFLKDFNKELTDLESKFVEKQNVELLIKELDILGKKTEGELDECFRIAKENATTLIKKFEALEKDIKFNEQVKQKIEYIYNQDFWYINGKEIEFLSDGKIYNVIDFIKEKEIVKDLELDIRTTLSETELKNISILGPKEKTVYLFEKKSVELNEQLSSYEAKIKDVTNSYLLDTGQLKSKYNEKVQELQRKMRDFLENQNFELGSSIHFATLLKIVQEKYRNTVSGVQISEIKNLISDIESMNMIINDQPIKLLSRLVEERKVIIKTLKDQILILNGLDSLFSTSICYALSSLTSSLFDNSDENWFDRSVEDVISENINKIFMTSIDKESIEKQKKEYGRYKINTAQQQNMVSALEDNPFTVYFMANKEVMFGDEYEDFERIKMAEYSTDVMNLAKEILTEQNVPYDLDYTEYKHLKIACFARLVNKLVVEGNLNVGLQQLVKKEKEMREKYPELNKLLKKV